MCLSLVRLRHGARGRLTISLASAIALMGAWATPARASTISLLDDPDSDGTFIDYVAASGEANQFFTLGIATGGRWAVQDGFGDVSITPTDPCTSGLPGGFNEPRFASCPADTLVWIRADLGDGADTGSASDGASTGVNFPAVLSGGAGPDTLNGGNNDDQLYGDEGSDSLGGWGGEDLLDGGTAADTLGGGDGIDFVDYTERTAPVIVTLGDGGANDGEAGEHDRVQPDIEGVDGGSGGDTLTGSAAADGLFGFNGPDTITGGAGADLIDAGAGSDTVAARDGVADEVDCGGGIDTVTADAADTVTGCENVLLPPPPPPRPLPPPPSTTTAPDITAPRLSMSLKSAYRLAPVRRKGLVVPLTCSEACVVKITLQMRASAARRLGIIAAQRLVVVGRTKVRLSNPGATKVRVRLNTKARRALRSVGRVKLTVRATANDIAGNKRVVTRRVTLTRRIQA